MNQEPVTVNLGELKTYWEAREALYRRNDATPEQLEILRQNAPIDMLATAIRMIEDTEERLKLCFSALMFADMEHDEERCARENHFFWCRDCLSYAAQD